MEVKKEPPEEFVIILPSPIDDSTEPESEEDDDEDEAEVKEEPLGDRFKRHQNQVLHENETPQQMNLPTEDSPAPKVKEEPPEEFVLVLPQPPDENVSSAPEEEEAEPQAEVKEEPQEDCLLELLPTSNRSREARARQRTKKQSNVEFTFTKDVKKRRRSKAIHICLICDVKFSRLIPLNRHMNEFHGAGFKCGKCSYEGKNEYNLADHQRVHAKSFKCETCGQKFVQNNPLKRHQMHNKHGIYANAPEEIFACDKCNKTFSTPAYLKQHMNRIHDEVEVACEICGKINKNRTALRKHRGAHVKVECSTCNKMVVKQFLSAHLRMHSAEYLFKCDLCEYSTKVKVNIKKHIERKHLQKKLKKEPRECSISNKMIPKRAMAWHLRMHSAGIKAGIPFECDLCEHSSKLKGNLKKHIERMHLQKKRVTKSKLRARRITKSKKIHECVACDATFSCKRLNDCHQRKFHGVELKCDMCSYETKKKEKLIPHLWTHVKPFMCDTCQKKFSRPQTLMVHQMHYRHGVYATAPAETFDCNKCGKTFSNRGYLDSHQKKIHDENEVECEFCGKICKNLLTLHTHRKTHEIVECSICRRIIPKSSLAYHLRSHAAEGLFERDCSSKTKIKRKLSRKAKHDKLLAHQKKLSLKRNLKTRQKKQRHGAIETAPEVFYGCDLCDTMFWSPHHLELHRRITHDEEEVKCGVCNKISKNREALRTHLRTHETIERPMQTPSAGKPFECDLCEYSAKMKDQLKGHIEGMHLQKKLKDFKRWEDFSNSKPLKKPQLKSGSLAIPVEKKFKCDKCKKTFVTPTTLRTHKKRVHVDILLECQLCKKAFKNKQGLKQHMSQVHFKISVK